MHAYMVHKFSATNYHISQTFGSPHTPSTFLGIETAAFYFSTMHTMANVKAQEVGQQVAQEVAGR